MFSQLVQRMQLKTPKAISCIAYLCLLSILVSLGIWQLNRAQEKRHLIVLQQSRQSLNPIDLKANSVSNIENFLYQPVHVVGHYDNTHQYLLDNQVSEGKVGYFVLTPFYLNSQGIAVLINRGWVPVGHDRSVLPNIPVNEDERELTGIINRFPQPGIKLKGAEIPSKTRPSLIQVVDVHVLGNQLGYKLFDFQVELDKAALDGFKRDWNHRVTMTPEKHLAYAGQWFLLAMLITVLFLKYGFKKTDG